MKARAFRALEALWSRPEQKIVVVTHGFYLRMLVAVATFEKRITPENFQDIFATFRTTNTGVTVFQAASDHDMWDPWMKDRRWIIRVWNDYAHLGDTFGRHHV
jgi:broad specificity phosphatase PhoE